MFFFTNHRNFDKGPPQHSNPSPPTCRRRFLLSPWRNFQRSGVRFIPPLISSRRQVWFLFSSLANTFYARGLSEEKGSVTKCTPRPCRTLSQTLTGILWALIVSADLFYLPWHTLGVDAILEDGVAGLTTRHVKQDKVGITFTFWRRCRLPIRLSDIPLRQSLLLTLAARPPQDKDTKHKTNVLIELEKLVNDWVREQGSAAGISEVLCMPKILWLSAWWKFKPASWGGIATR